MHLHMSFFCCKFAAELNTLIIMKKILPWLVGLGIVAIVVLVCANIYDGMVEMEDAGSEPAWGQQDSITDTHNEVLDD